MRRGCGVTLGVGCTVVSSETPPPGGWPSVDLTATFELTGDLTPRGVDVPMPVSTGEVLCALEFGSSTGIAPGTPFESHLGCAGTPGTEPWPLCQIGPHPPWTLEFFAPSSGAVVDVVQTLDFAPAAPEAVPAQPSFTG